MKNKILVILGLTAMISFVWQCSPEHSVVPDEYDFNSRVRGDLFIGVPSAIVIRNFAGPVIIDGQGIDSTLSWFLDKWVSARTQAEAEERFAQIQLDAITQNDTLYLDVQPPETFRALLSLTIPFQTVCIVRQVTGSTIVSNLRATFTGEGLQTTSLISHVGSSRILGLGGNISVQIVLPDSGYCNVQTETGDINLQIPSSTSATLSAKTRIGTISFTNLTIDSLNQIPMSLTGSLGAGLSAITLDTKAGNITIVGF